MASRGVLGDAIMAERVLDSLPDGILIVEHGGRITYANTAMRELVGTDSDLRGRSVDELVPDAMRARHVEFRRTFESDPYRRDMGAGSDLALRRADGTDLPVEIALSPFDGDGEHRVIAAVRDVSTRRRNERRLTALSQQLTLVEERERIGRDLHDVILQQLYGTGMTVQAIAAGVDEVTATRLEGVVADLDRMISEVRTIVFTLGSAGEHHSLGQELTDVVGQASRVLGFTPTLRVDGPVESVLGDDARAEMMASLREALGNVARHASATRASVDVSVTGPNVVLSVSDDGVGPPDPSGQPRHGNGLVNLRARASALGGSCVLSPGPQQGSVLTWTVPY